MDNMIKINEVFSEIQNIYLKTIHTFKTKTFDWLQENYTNINIFLKEHYNNAKKIYEDNVIDVDCKLIKLLQIRLCMKKEINNYLDKK